MKIAIMTQPLGKNYGGIMQAWALQQVLKRMGHEPVTIDRQPDAKSPAYHAARLGYRTLRKALGKRKAPINFERHLPIILQHTQAFIDQNLSMSEPLDSTAKLKAHFEREQYDAVIVGSDQTWRPKYSPNIDNFFLDFLEGSNIKRIAYASSFGVDEWEFTEEQTQRCAVLAKQFDAISVREDSAVELCRKYLGVEATHVLDPTLLLEKADYEQLLGPERLEESPSAVYTYFLDRTPEKLALAQRIGDKLGCAVYSCQAKRALFEEYTDLQDWVMPDIKDWLAGFANSSFIVTDSFHGVIFSIVFGKDFVSIGNIDRGAARFDSVLGIYGLKEKLLQEGSLNDFRLEENIDSESFYFYDNPQRRDSFSLLAKVFESEGGSIVT